MPTDSIDIEEHAVALQENVTLTAYDVSAVRARHGDWAELPKADRRRIVEAEAPVQEVQETHNVTCIGLHEYLPSLLNFKNDYDAVVDHAAEVAFGTDASTFAVSDRELNNEVGRIALTDPSDRTDTWAVSEFLSSVELNGSTLSELGIYSESGVLWNHAPIPNPISKDSSIAVIADISLPFGDQSEV